MDVVENRRPAPELQDRSPVTARFSFDAKAVSPDSRMARSAVAAGFVQGAFSVERTGVEGLGDIFRCCDPFLQPCGLYWRYSGEPMPQYSFERHGMRVFACTPDGKKLRNDRDAVELIGEAMQAG